jgi:hypothetical protein
MLDNSTNYLTLLSHYLFCLFLVALLSLTINSVLNSKKEHRITINSEKTGILILKQKNKSW